MNIIDAYDLVCLVASMETPPSLLTAQKINLLTKHLAEKGIESHFYMSSFEAIQFEYPDCISVSRTEIFIGSPRRLGQISSKQLEEPIKKLINDIINDD